MRIVAVTTCLLLFFALSAGAQSPTPAPEAKELSVFGQKISYFEAGSGPAVILLHGLGGNKNLWKTTLADLSPSFHVFAIDQLGFGASDKPLINYRVATLVDFLEEFMTKAGIEKATLAGNSLGGWVAASFALAHPGRVDRIILIDTAGYFPKPFRRQDVAYLNPSTLAESRQVLRKVLFNKQFINDVTVKMFFSERLSAGDSYTIDRMIDSIIRGEDIMNERWASITTPTLVVWGREDALVPLADGELIASRIPGARKVILANCGHIPELECAPALDSVLLEYLKTPLP
ncbi:MAG: alpha/beta hydrolase [Acidobacteriota bacterium]